MERKMCTVILLFLCLLSSRYAEGAKDGIYNVKEFGAKGDGETLDTKAIQSAIDQCNQEGGGKVLFNGGCFISGTVYLKDNVGLEIVAGTVLRASNNLDDFPIIESRHPSYTGEFVTNKMLIYAEDVKNITVCGRGTIDGNGDYWIGGPYGSPSFSVRPRIIHFRGCENVRILDLTLYNSASWVQSYQSCRDLVIDGITVQSRENKDIEKERYADARGRNTDGLDLVDCRQVRIANCFINSGDDAICLKSFSPDEACSDIVISNCVVSSNASGIKIGTETAGTFHDITVQNCTVFDTRADALSVMTTDGARLERINFSNISIRNIKGAAIFVRLGNRNRPYRKNAVINQPILKDIVFDNIQGTRISSRFGCSLTGIIGYPVENIVLSNVNLQFEGGQNADDSYRVIPEREKDYPNGLTFGTLPAYGLFARHIRNVHLNDVFLRFEKEDHRPALLCEDAEGLEIRRLMAPGTMHSPELIRLVNVRDVLISECNAVKPVPYFVSLYGEKSNNILLKDNFLQKVNESLYFGEESLKRIVKETGTIK